MERTYNPAEIEPKWSQHWLADNIYRAEDLSSRPKKYILVEFPYPSGSGLHCGHVYRFTLPDIYSRKLRMEGYNVLFPIGWDAFGLPAEQYAVKTGVHPSVTTEEAVTTYQRQMKMMGFGFDWEREINSTDPEYYKWTQWIFLRFFERGLAELKEQPVWWCESLRTVLANEEVLDDGKGGKISERGEHPVEKRMLKQWVLKIPAYADKLLAGLDTVEFPESVRHAQRSWIGRSEGGTLQFPLSVSGKQLSIFTTRPDTILGATFMVLAPEHPLLKELRAQIQNWDEIEKYQIQTQRRSEVDRKAAKEKTGVLIKGVTASNPFNPQAPALPLFIADYVLMEYGTGAIMAVPAHDERDYEFAQTFKLPVVQTICSHKTSSSENAETKDPLPFVAEDGWVNEIPATAIGKASALPLSATEMKNLVLSTLEREGKGIRTVTYKIRDWLFSRQRYWGEPMPLLHRQDGSVVGVASTKDQASVDKNLPIVLPSVPDYLPSSDGYSPLAKNKDWVQTTDQEGRPALRETNTMPNWAGSSWYYLRYIDPKNPHSICDRKKMEYWMPVDRYFGGSEHTTLHLLYSRFWHRFLYDEGVVNTPEPYAWRMNGGVLLGPDSQRMSKSRGNIINPDDKVAAYGADALRLYINFMGPYDGTLPWSENGLKACRRLIDRIYSLREKVRDSANAPEFERSYHKLVKNVSWMIDALKTNTSVSEIMIFVNAAEATPHINRESWRGFIKILAPFAVFAAEDLWQESHGYTAWKPEQSVHLQSWPQFDPKLAIDEFLTLGVQINGKVRDEVQLLPDEPEESVRAKVLELPGVQKWLEGKTPKKFIYIKNRIVNIVA